jgi:uncharacterized protein
MIAGIVLKIAGACNLNCHYCYVYHGRDTRFRERPALLAEDLAGALARRIAHYCAERPGHRISVCLHGGEPLLIGRRRFRALVERLRAGAGKALGSIVLQTNGVLVDREWVRLFAELNVAVSLSLDGSRADHDAERVDHAGRGSFTRAARGLALLLEAKRNVSVLCVVRPGGDGAAAYRQLRALGATSIDFLLPDMSHDDRAAQLGGLGPTPIADYLVPALRLWLAEDDPGISVRLFEDAFRLLLGDSGESDAFGGTGPTSYVVVETDGSIQANDALRVCEGDIAITGLNIAEDELDAFEQAEGPAAQILRGEVALPTACRACPEAETCAGGYLPHRYSRARGFDNPSVWCEDIKLLFAEMRTAIARDGGALAA